MPQTKKYLDFVASAPYERGSKHGGPDARRSYVTIACPHCDAAFVEIAADRLHTNKASECLKHLRVCDAAIGAGVLAVVRVKDRFKHPSGGGWRDVMINFYVVSDGAKHVCEVQLVHKSLLTARKGLPGHIIYGVVRNATEVLEVLGLLIKFERAAGLRALVDAGWGREAIERLGLPARARGASKMEWQGDGPRNCVEARRFQ